MPDLCPKCWNAGRHLWSGCCLCTGDVKPIQRQQPQPPPTPEKQVKTDDLPQKRLTKKQQQDLARYQEAMKQQFI